MSNYPIILGVYSLQKEIGYGTSGTSNKKQNITYWYVRQIEKNKFEVQPLNNYHLPSGHTSVVSRSEFLVNYTPEPTYYQNNHVQELFELAYKVQRCKHNLSEDSLDQKDKRLIEQLKIFESKLDGDNNDNKGSLTNNDYGAIKKALDLLLASNDSVNFVQKKHLNNCAINLRKDGYYDKSLCYYEKSLEVTREDENIYFNMARVYFAKGLKNKCISILEQALSINPNFKEAKKFLKYCHSNKGSN